MAKVLITIKVQVILQNEGRKNNEARRVYMRVKKGKSEGMEWMQKNHPNQK